MSRSFVVFSPPVVGALAAYVFTPSFPEQDEVDLDAHYFSVAPWAFGLVGVLVVLAGLADLLVPGGEPLPLGAFLAGGLLFFVLGQVRRKALHWAMLSVVWVVPLYGAFFGRT